MAGYHHGDLRASLLTAARKSLESDQGRELSLRALAVTVGVSPNAPYRHFPTKETLLAALAAQGFEELTAAFSPHRAAGGQARLQGDLAAYLAFARGNPGVYRLMFGRDLDPLSCDPELGARAQACFKALEATMAVVMGLDPADPALLSAAAIVWSVSHGAALLEIDNATSFLPTESRPSAEDMATVIVHGVGMEPA